MPGSKSAKNAVQPEALKVGAPLTSPKKSWGGNIILGGVSSTQKAIFAKNLAIMLKSGLSIIEALSISYSSATGRLKNIIGEIFESVSAGNSLSSSLARYPKCFSQVFISVTFAGESSGTLEQNLEVLSLQLQKERELVGKIKQAMLYPIIVLAASFILGLTMSYYVLPKILPLFEGMKMNLPLTTKLLISFSYFMRDHGAVFSISCIAGAIFLIWLFRQKFTYPFSHWIILRLPVVSKIMVNNNLARFCRNLNMLLVSGLNIDRALDITKDTLNNYYYQQAVGQISQRVAKGVSLSEDLKSFDRLFPTMLIRMIMVGEKSGQLEESLNYLADFYEGEVDAATKNLSVIIEPILLLIIGAVVAFLALSIITPIYNLTGNLNA